MKTIGLLTSGGDAPGMNACIRAIVRTCVYNGIRVMGIRFGFDGLIRGDIYETVSYTHLDVYKRQVQTWSYWDILLFRIPYKIPYDKKIINIPHILDYF